MSPISTRAAVARYLMCVVVIAMSVGVVGWTKDHDDDEKSKDHDRGPSYLVRYLVSDGSTAADHVDPQLVNPWGIAFNPTGLVWLSLNETGVSTLYDGAGVKSSLVVEVPTPPGGAPPSAPTGIVFSGGADFIVTANGKSGPSRFIFATEDGTISGWAPNVDGTHAIRVVDNAGTGALYKGLALGGNGTGHFLYATDFRHGRVEVFDASFQAATLSGDFRDPRVPRGYAPFGIQNILGSIYVTYAKQDASGTDDVAGPGLGFVSVFDANGHLIRRLVSRGVLNAPWGLALAPADFGHFSNALLVANFGDGRINAFDPFNGEPLGVLRGRNGRAVTVDGLWGISFGNGVLSQPTNTLFFTAGPDDEAHGIYGRIDVEP